MDTPTLDRIARELPIFPLPGVVLMPGALLPLHVFELRYQALVRDVQEGGGFLGLATLQPGYEAEYEGSPPVWPEIGVAELVGHQPFPDGRCNIVLQYVGAVEMQSERETDRPYRVVSARARTLHMGGARQAITGLQLMVLQLGAISPAAAAEARRLVDLDGTELVDSLARKLLQKDDAQRAYLRAERLVDRIDMVRERLADFMAVATPTARA